MHPFQKYSMTFSTCEVGDRQVKFMFSFEAWSVIARGCDYQWFDDSVGWLIELKLSQIGCLTSPFLMHFYSVVVLIGHQWLLVHFFLTTCKNTRASSFPICRNSVKISSFYQWRWSRCRLGASHTACTIWKESTNCGIGEDENSGVNGMIRDRENECEHVEDVVELRNVTW